MKRLTLVGLGVIVSCASGAPAVVSSPASAGSTGASGGSSGALPAVTVTSQPTPDAPEISRSQGVTEGVLVLWPRMVPREAGPEARDTAQAIQRRLRRLAEEALPGRPVDVRPEPERVCPRAGCNSPTLGAVFARVNNGCVVVASVSAPGTAPARLIPWVGAVRLRQTEVPFREPQEGSVTITDAARCTEVVGALESAPAELLEALRGVAPAR